jgi:hypothetical protein
MGKGSAGGRASTGRREVAAVGTLPPTLPFENAPMRAGQIVQRPGLEVNRSGGLFACACAHWSCEGVASDASQGAGIMNRVERLVVTLKLRKRTGERAAELIAAGPPFDPADLGLARHAVYLGDDLVIFAFEGEDVEQRVRSLINDPVRSASFAAWMPLLAGRPALAHETFYWEATPDT